MQINLGVAIGKEFTNGVHADGNVLHTVDCEGFGPYIPKVAWGPCLQESSESC